MARDRLSRRPYAIAGWSLLLALAACSGGGGGGTGGRPIHDPSDFETPEYRANYGLAGLNAAAAYVTGASGRGVTVAVVDSGIDVDHPEFAGALHPGATDIVTGNPAFLDDAGGHGTAVAGVIGARRNGQGGHGVAYNATLLPIRADVPDSCAAACAFTQDAVADATAYAVASGARVINYSLGGAPSIGATLHDALAAAAARGVVLVISAGNGGGAAPTYPGRFAAEPGAAGAAIVVGAVDERNRIAPFSNRAGAARNAYLVAPGTNVRTTWLGGGAASVDGTSFSAPHVAGAAAVVLDAAPHLSAQEVVRLLLTTATDLGAPGTDRVYGRGLVNLEAALSPQGTLAVPTGAMVDGPAVALAGTRLRAGGAFGAALARAPGLRDAVLLDRYGRAYRVDLSHRITPAPPLADLAGWLAPGGAVRTTTVGAGGRLGLTLALIEEGSRSAAEREGGPWGRDGAGPPVGLTATGRVGDATRFTVAQGAGLGAAFGPAAESDAGVGAFGDLLGRGALAAPFAAFLDGGDALTVERELAGGLALRLAVASSSGRGSSTTRPTVGNGGRTAYLVEVSRRGTGGAELSLHVGELRERGSLLDAAGDGALALGHGARTRFVGLGGRLPLAPRLDLLGQVALGRTEPEDSGGGGVIRDVSTLHSAAFGAGLGFRRVFRPGDRLAVVASRPLKVVAGRATVDVPVARTIDGRVVRRAERTSLVPAGDEIDLELSYGTELGRSGTLGLNLLTRFEPGHEAGAAPEVVAGVRYGLKF